MLTSMKILIEKQVKNWQGDAKSPSPVLKTAACGYRPNSSALLAKLQNGGCVLTATPSEVPKDSELDVDLPVFKLQSRVEVSSSEDPVDWEAQISRSLSQNLTAGSARLAQAETLSQEAKINRLVHLMMLAIRSGNIGMAMMLFSHLETSTANQMTQVLMKKVQEIQDQKRKLVQDIQSQKTDAEGNKKLQALQNEVSQANDDISTLQTFIRDVAQNKQTAVEVANAFLSKEHETTMAVVRSFGR